eukprot:3128355-Rhodomonas_salina.1
MFGQLFQDAVKSFPLSLFSAHSASLATQQHHVNDDRKEIAKEALEDYDIRQSLYPPLLPRSSPSPLGLCPARSLSPSLILSYLALPLLLFPPRLLPFPHADKPP